MCDTLVYMSHDAVWFAKNSDREPSEEQLLEYLPAATEEPLIQRTTYLDIEVAGRTQTAACYISRPSWMWGAEIGVNEHGVAIGNEAVFSKARTLTPGLLGMDLLRLGLQGSCTATAALECITALLERYGQGGPAGHRNKRFHYDNSFLIADSKGCWLLETVERHWAAKYWPRPAKGAEPVVVAISNRYQLGQDFDRHSKGLQAFAQQHLRASKSSARLHFANTFDTRLLPYFAAARTRAQSNRRCLQQRTSPPSWADFAALLRSHQPKTVHPQNGSNADTCMHAAGPIRQSQTTASLIAQLSHSSGQPQLIATGTSAPCLSLFKPLNFSHQNWTVVHQPGAKVGQSLPSLWQQHEAVHHRALFDATFRQQVQTKIAKIEAQWLPVLSAEVEPAELQAANQLCALAQQQLYHQARVQPLKYPLNPYGFFWRR